MSDTLIIDDDDRYSRLRLISWWEQEKLLAAKVLVVGAGALGNEVLKNLALLGVGTIYLIDMDTIDKSNLTRSVLFRAKDRGRPKVEVAAEMLAEINPDTRVVPIHGNVITDVGLGLFRDADVTVGCLDNREARLWVNRQCWKVTRPWIDGGIQEISGVTKVFVPPNGPCYECGMTERDYQLINLRYSCPLLKQEDLLAGKVPTAPTIASFVGALQTQEALKLIHGMPVSDGQALVFSGATNHFYATKYQRREDCLSHETYPEPVELPLTAAGAKASELFAAVKAKEKVSGPLSLHLDRDLVVAVEGAGGKSKRIMRPQQLVGMKDALDPETGESMRPRMVHQVDEGTELAGETLATLGIPAYDIVRVSWQSGEGVYLLGGDREKYKTK